jgi:hypothetical protein
MAFARDNRPFLCAASNTGVLRVTIRDSHRIDALFFSFYYNYFAGSVHVFRLLDDEIGIKRKPCLNFDVFALVPLITQCCPISNDDNSRINDITSTTNAHWLFHINVTHFRTSKVVLSTQIDRYRQATQMATQMLEPERSFAICHVRRANRSFKARDGNYFSICSVCSCQSRRHRSHARLLAPTCPSMINYRRCFNNALYYANDFCFRHRSHNVCVFSFARLLFRYVVLLCCAVARANWRRRRSRVSISARRMAA